MHLTLLLCSCALGLLGLQLAELRLLEVMRPSQGPGCWACWPAVLPGQAVQSLDSWPLITAADMLCIAGAPVALKSLAALLSTLYLPLDPAQ